MVADRLEDLTVWLARLADHGGDIDSLTRADEVRRPVEDQREAHASGGRHTRLLRLMREMPELAADLDVTAPGSAHTPTRQTHRRRGPGLHNPSAAGYGFRVRELTLAPRNDKLLRHHAAAPDIDAVGFK